MNLAETREFPVLAHVPGPRTVVNVRTPPVTTIDGRGATMMNSFGPSTESEDPMGPLSRDRSEPSRDPYPLRLLIIAAGGVLLLTGLWTGLQRLDRWFISIPFLNRLPHPHHGPLMMGGFLGVVIGLERAVGFKKWWGFLAPILCGAGGFVLLSGLKGGPVWVTSGSLVFGAMMFNLFRRHTSVALGMMGAGSAAWILGNMIWLRGYPLYMAVPWWVLFLIWFIVGERVELNTLKDPSPATGLFLFGCCFVSASGAVLLWLSPVWGIAVAGIGIGATGLWLLYWDLARHTVFTHGQAQYSAASMLAGYFWLVVSGGLWILHGDEFFAGPAYGSMLHGVFLGFVFSMIFGHAPIIAGVVTGKPLPFHRVFYIHLLLLHFSLAVRILGNQLNIPWFRFWGGVGNVGAILIFMVVTVGSVLRSQHTKSAGAKN